jgi:AraC-like DNA-binding protein
MDDHESDHSAITFAGETRVIEDVDAMSGAMSDGLRGEFVQLDAPSFRGRWTTVRVGTVVAQFGSEDTAVAHRIRVPTDRWAFVLPLEVPAGARWNGHDIRPGHVLVCLPGAEWLAFDPPVTRFAILMVRSATLPATGAGPFLAPDAVGLLASACAVHALALRDRLSRIRDRVEAGGAWTLSDFDRCLEGRLTACMACLQQAVGRQRGDASKGTRSRIVCRAEAFFRRHVGDCVSVARLSTLAGVSERSLRNAFRDVYTTSPKRYMTLWRLHQVRRALRSRGLAGATVTEVATRHGFYELGRFAGEYRSAFGETPSETLNKARGAGMGGSAPADSVPRVRARRTGSFNQGGCGSQMPTLARIVVVLSLGASLCACSRDTPKRAPEGGQSGVVATSGTGQNTNATPPQSANAATAPAGSGDQTASKPTVDPNAVQAATSSAPKPISISAGP